MNRWPARPAALWEEAPFLRLLPALCLAIVLYDRGLLNESGFRPVLLLSACSVLVFSLLSISQLLNPWLRLLAALSLQTAVLSLGLLACMLQDVRRQPAWFGHISPEAGAGFVARLDQHPAPRARTWKLEVSLQQYLGPDQSRPARGKALVYLYRDSSIPDLQRGDLLLLPAAWERIRNAGNPYEFDYARHCARNQIYHRQFLGANQLLRYHRDGSASFTERAHDWSMTQLSHYLRDTATMGLMQAMLIGDETHMEEELRQAYADTGVIHVVAISGSHITFVFWLAAGLLFWIRHRKYQWLKYALALPLVWFYVLMAGAPPSAIRAALMFSLLTGGLMLSRERHPLNTLLATAFILLAARPMWLFAIGFQLSFVAVLSLIIFFKPIYKRWPITNLPGRLLWMSASASLAAELLVAPLVAYYFHLFPALFLPANLLAYLFMGLILILGMALLATAALPAVAGVIASFTTWLVGVFNAILGWMRGFNPEALAHLQLSQAEVLLLYACVAGLGLLWLRQMKHGLGISLAAACALLLISCHDAWHMMRQERLVVYSTGRQPAADLVRGRYHQELLGPNSHYALKNARTGLGAWRQMDADALPYVQLGQRRILMLDSSLDLRRDGALPTDILVVCRSLKGISLSLLQERFKPRMLVLGGQNRWRIPAWTDSCRRAGIALHSTVTDGALLLQAR